MRLLQEKNLEKSVSFLERSSFPPKMSPKMAEQCACWRIGNGAMLLLYEKNLAQHVSTVERHDFSREMCCPMDAEESTTTIAL